ncbi:MAG: hypothetical protein Q9P01_11505 [Anaerolineae bacterium]|nr:hypothetical protein [Anaerolineae bacterium]
MNYSRIPTMPLPIPAENRQRLLIFNLRTDIDDHILGFTTQWINALLPRITQQLMF